MLQPQLWIGFFFLAGAYIGFMSYRKGAFVLYRNQTFPNKIEKTLPPETRRQGVLRLLTICVHHHSGIDGSDVRRHESLPGVLVRYKNLIHIAHGIQ